MTLVRAAHRSACALAALCVNGALLLPFFSVAPEYRDQTAYALAGVPSPANGYTIEPLTLVELDEVADTDTEWPEPPALRTFTLPGHVELAIPDIDLALSSNGQVEASTSTARSAEPVDDPGEDRAQLFARYVNQIRARIDRAWERPASGARCTAHVSQDSRGAVLDVEIEGCSADESWRESLVTAIRRASPLPAPPVSQVFTEHVALEFSTLN